MRKNAIIRHFHIGFPFFFFLNTREFRPYFIQSVVSTCNCVDTARLEFKVFKSKAQLWLAHLRFYFWCKLYFKTDEITVHIKKKAHRSHTHPNTHTHSHTHTHTHTHTLQRSVLGTAVRTAVNPPNVFAPCLQTFSTGQLQTTGY